MTVNWKVRLRNPVFWTTMLPSLVALIYSILAIFGVVPSISESTVLNVVPILITTLTTLGVLVDPTTSTLSDSETAMTYEEPQ